MKEIEDYIIVHDKYKRFLSKKIINKSKEGYELVGGISVDSLYYYQAMVKHKNNAKSKNNM